MTQVVDRRNKRSPSKSPRYIKEMEMSILISQGMCSSFVRLPPRANAKAKAKAKAKAGKWSGTGVRCAVQKAGTGTSKDESLKGRLGKGDTLYGMFLCSFSPTLAEIAAHAGYDFVVVDMEHGFGGIPEALSCLRALSAASTPAILRLPESSAAWAKKALDLGPQGIMFPMINSPLDALNAVSYCRYPPKGVRGAAHPIVRASAYGVDSASYLSSCEDDLLLMCQVESQDAVPLVQDIAAVEGVDCIQMGPLDLSASMGYLWDPGNKKVMQTLHQLEKSVSTSGGAYLSGFAMPHDTPHHLKSRGYHMITGTVDIALFRAAAVQDVNNFKLTLDTPDSDPNPKDGDEKYWSE
ncbi:hypothetical protein vseg_014051 [Gypsophila vaccaria]